MCEKCEQREQEEKIIASQEKEKRKDCSCADGHHCAVEQPEQPKIKSFNSEATLEDVKNIDDQIKKQHEEIIQGYDKQLGDCIRDICNHATKMMIMYQDYLKHGNTEGCVRLLQSMIDYGYMTQMASTVIIQSGNMMIGKVRNNG